MRMIDADALKERILKERDKIPQTVPAAPYELVKAKPNRHGNSMRGGIRVALRCMEQTPTIEAEPVKHGRWLQPKSGECFCSECKTNGSPQWKRCPVCEAKMDGGDEDGDRTN